jgi:WD40-like Beta Propeller Repeat
MAHIDGQSMSESAGWAGVVLNARGSRRCIERVILKPAESRGLGLMVLGLLVAGILLCGCGSGGVSPTPPLLPSQTPAAPASVSQLPDAPTVTDLAGWFAYGTDVGHIWVVDAATGKRTQVTHGRAGTDFDPHWSPDGKRLVFRTERFHPPDPDQHGLRRHLRDQRRRHRRAPGQPPRGRTVS